MTLIKDRKGGTPRLVLVGDPEGNHKAGDRLALNQFTGNTARCNKHNDDSMRKACRCVDERRT